MPCSRSYFDQVLSIKYCIPHSKPIFKIHKQTTQTTHPRLRTARPQHPTKADRSKTIGSLIPLKVSTLQDKSIFGNTSIYARKITTMAATWSFCSRDGFEYTELVNGRSSLQRRYFDWRDNVASADTNVPASCRMEVDRTPRKVEWIEMKDMSSSSGYAGKDDADKDDGFDDCKAGEPEDRGSEGKGGFWCGVKQVVQAVDKIIVVKRP